MNKEQLVMKSLQRKTKGDSNRLAEADHKVLGAKLTEIICHKASFKHLLRGKRGNHRVVNVFMSRYLSFVVQ